MAVYRDISGKINRQEFENHLKATTRKEGYMEVLMYTPDPNIQVATVSSDDKLNICDIDAVININDYSSNTIATLEENLWLLNGRFINYQGNQVKGYISNSISDDNGDFSTNPTILISLSHTSTVEDFSVTLNSAVPTGYPNSITVYCYDQLDQLLSINTQSLKWQEPTGEIDEHGDPIYKTVILDSLPSVNFSIQSQSVDHVVVEFNGTQTKHRRIRVSSVMFGKMIVLDQNDILNVNYTDKTSYVCDTLPSRTFSFDVNNYNSIYDIDNPDNGYVNLNKQTRVRFRNGYNVCGYQYDQNGYVIMEDGSPVIDLEQDGVEIEWDDWIELRLLSVSTDANVSATFTAGSLLDAMEDVYTKEYYIGGNRTIKEIIDNILTFEGLDLNSVEYSSDGIKHPTYDNNGQLLPYVNWEDTLYEAYTINTPVPEAQCKQIIQMLAFSVGATILIKNNGHIKLANLNLADPTSFTNHYEWNYRDFVSVPAAEQLLSVSNLEDISLPKYYSNLDRSGEVSFTNYPNCTIVTTINCTSASQEIQYSECMPVGCRIAADDTSGATIISTELYCKRGIVVLGGYVAGTTVKIEVIGYPIKTTTVQERNVTSDTLVLNTNVMNYDVPAYNTNGSGDISETEQIKRKYLEWYKKKFKYKISTRGEPLVNAGDYAIIQTQFTQNMPVYILQNHWTFDGAWSGDMEVIALD